MHLATRGRGCGPDFLFSYALKNIHCRAPCTIERRYRSAAHERHRTSARPAAARLSDTHPDAF
eukprot:47841-Prymnesium_polylepis.1